MDETSLPVLPHLPAAESWRESSYTLASPRSRQLQTLDDALESYENSFRRYGVISQAYYLQLNAQDDPPGRHRGQEVESVKEEAQMAFSRAVHDFEAVESAFDTWANSAKSSLGEPGVQQLSDLLSAGRSQLSPDTPQVRLPQQREDLQQAVLPQQRAERATARSASGSEPLRNPLQGSPQESRAEGEMGDSSTGRHKKGRGLSLLPRR
jgi:hypothetical protein